MSPLVSQMLPSSVKYCLILSSSEGSSSIISNFKRGYFTLKIRLKFCSKSKVHFCRYYFPTYIIFPSHFLYLNSSYLGKMTGQVPHFSKTRLAPTPSGFLHLGNVLSFAITAAIAAKTGAKILLRIDDLDRDRVNRDYVQDIFDTLNFLEIPW